MARRDTLCSRFVCRNHYLHSFGRSGFSGCFVDDALFDRKAVGIKGICCSRTDEWINGRRWGGLRLLGQRIIAGS